jgi:hypothetical protein
MYKRNITNLSYLADLGQCNSNRANPTLWPKKRSSLFSHKISDEERKTFLLNLEHNAKLKAWEYAWPDRAKASTISRCVSTHFIRWLLVIDYLYILIWKILHFYSKLLALVLNSLDTLFDVRIKAFMLFF